jgi:hypothetical protein
MRSLFILSLPRSLSTTTYRAAARALGLAEPSWALQGEILNRDLVRRRRINRPGRVKFLTSESDAARFDKVVRFLDCAAQPEGFAYKDVVQPFVLSQWEGIDRFAVLKIRREPAEVAFAMLNRNWTYPSRVAIHRPDRTGAVVEGLLRAEAAVARVPGVTVEFAHLIESEDALAAALSTLYPDVDLPMPSYIDDHFVRGRALREAARSGSTDYSATVATVNALRASVVASAA